MRKNNTSVFMKATTWNRESHGLFDYGSQQVSSKNLKATSSSKIVRIQNDIHLMTDFSNERTLSQNSETLAYLHSQDETFVLSKADNINNGNENSSIDNLWIVVKSLTNENRSGGVPLQPFDIIKLGRFKFLIREMKILKDNENGNQLKDSNGEECNINRLDYLAKIRSKPITDKEITCRICLSNEDSKENPLISPCVCSGSVSYVHITCIRQWLNSKITPKENGMGIINHWKTFECEICRKSLPDVAIRDEKAHFLIDPPKPEPCYIMLETIGKEKTSKTAYLMLGVNQSNIKIGRGNDCDIRINDISVSRFHAFIRYSEGKFYLEDNDSKFGTLLLVKDKITLGYEESPSIQMGRTVINFSLNNKGHMSNTSRQHSGLQTEPSKKEDEYDIVNDKPIKFTIPKPETLTEKRTNIFDDNEKGKDISPRQIQSSEDETTSIDKKMFNLKLDKDKTDYSHLQGFLDKGKTVSSTKANDDKTREKKNILNEMEHLIIDDEDKEEESNNHLFLNYSTKNYKK